MTASETPPVPNGYVLLRWDTLAGILGRQTTPPPEPDPAAATFEAMSSAIALITARLGERATGLPPADQAALTAGVPAAALIRTFAIVTAAALAAALPRDSLTALLQDLGADAIRLAHPATAPRSQETE